MPPLLRKLLPASRYPYAALAGLALALSFPNASVAGLAWIAPGLILTATIGRTGAEVIRIGYWAGLAHYLGSLYWLLNIPFRWHGIPLAPAVGWLALSSFLALFIAGWVWLMNRLASPRSPREWAGLAAGAVSPEDRLGGQGLRFLAQGWSARLLWCLTGAAAWVALEMCLARVFGGFPWNVLAASQFRMTPLLQIASVTGVYGVSFLIVWFSLALVAAGTQLVRQPFNRSHLVLELALPGLVVALVFNWGVRQLRPAAEPERFLHVTLVQPSIQQTLIWDPGSDDARLRELIDLSRQALTNTTDLLLWPEAAVPKLLRYDQEVFEAITGLARNHRVWMIIGADDAQPRTDKPDQADYFNSSFLVGPDGALRATYKKQALVIFGEYIPLSRWLPFLKWFTPIQGGFTPGTGPVPFHLPDLDLTTSVLICYEDIFPRLGRRAAQTGADFLVNLTNDGWFGEGAAQWQQAVTALFRAIENRMPLIRATNNGLTCWIDAQGRIREYFTDARGSIYGPGFLRVELPLAPHPAAGRTFYQRHGDWFGWTCVGWTLLAVAVALASRRRQTQPPPE